jgi:hypothetical protein
MRTIANWDLMRGVLIHLFSFSVKKAMRKQVKCRLNDYFLKSKIYYWHLKIRYYQKYYNL